MNRLLTILILVFSFSGLSQEQKSVEKKWKETVKRYEYQKSKNYNGPKDYYGTSPTGMKGVDNDRDQQPKGHTSPSQIDYVRNKGKQKGNGGDMPNDPKTKMPDPIKLPEFDPPDIDPPDVDLPDVDPPSISPEVWKFLLILIIAALVVFLIYWLIKSRKPSNKKVAGTFVDMEWNPEIISKTELELRLDEALAKANYREGVRIYFTFILKEMIRLNWIRWRKEKTNFDYLAEVGAKPKAHLFRECVRIYELVWYGEYELDRSDFSEIEPVLKNYYDHLKETK